MTSSDVNLPLELEEETSGSQWTSSSKEQSGNQSRKGGKAMKETFGSCVCETALAGTTPVALQLPYSQFSVLETDLSQMLRLNLLALTKEERCK
jgi:hypothetical protein